MTKQLFYGTLREQFTAGKPTEDQEVAMDALTSFVFSAEDQLMVIKGSAGTGKTSLVAALVNALPKKVMPTVLMAPTGRAAKVMGQYTQKKANTIHRYIYQTQNNGLGYRFSLRHNGDKDTLYIVDEASMLGLEGQEGTQSLLHDLFEFVFGSNQARHKLILVGDNAQLPPVGQNESPALQTEYLQSAFGLPFIVVQLNQVVRQAWESGILRNATRLRNLIYEKQDCFPIFEEAPDFIRMLDPYESMDMFNNAFYDPLEMESVVILRSNKRANLYNTQIRGRIMFKEEEISAGDLIMSVKNNYFWLDSKSPAGFIANGDLLEIIRPGREEKKYGLTFRHASVRLVDYPEQPSFDTVFLMESLYVESPSLPPADFNRFLEELAADHPGLSKGQFWGQMRKSPYFNALQVKFAYAITAHKSQGGQWKHVFIEQPYMPEKTPTIADLRWLYTAITRATEKVYLMNFSEDFFAEIK